MSVQALGAKVKITLIASEPRASFDFATATAATVKTAAVTTPAVQTVEFSERVWMIGHHHLVWVRARARCHSGLVGHGGKLGLNQVRAVGYPNVEKLHHILDGRKADMGAANRNILHVHNGVAPKDATKTDGEVLVFDEPHPIPRATTTSSAARAIHVAVIRPIVATPTTDLDKPTQNQQSQSQTDEH
jgi:hypothetical protein